MSGKGVFTWPNGRHFEGEYKEDRRHGKGKLTKNDGTVVQGDWLAGKLTTEEVQIGTKIP